MYKKGLNSRKLFFSLSLFFPYIYAPFDFLFLGGFTTWNPLVVLIDSRAVAPSQSVFFCASRAGKHKRANCSKCIKYEKDIDNFNKKENFYDTLDLTLFSRLKNYVSTYIERNLPTLTNLYIHFRLVFEFMGENTHHLVWLATRVVQARDVIPAPKVNFLHQSYCKLLYGERETRESPFPLKYLIFSFLLLFDTL